MGSGSEIPPSLSCSSFTGKSFTLSWLSENRFFPLENFLVLDFDIVREFLPESQLTHNTSLFTSLSIQKEVGYLVEVRRPHRFHGDPDHSQLITYGALMLGKSVLVDGSLKDHGWYSNYFPRLRAQFPSLRIGLFHITSPLKLVLSRVESRAEKTG
jgi:hypothetical protein